MRLPRRKRRPNRDIILAPQLMVKGRREGDPGRAYEKLSIYGAAIRYVGEMYPDNHSPAEHMVEGVVVDVTDEHLGVTRAIRVRRQWAYQCRSSEHGGEPPRFE